MSRLELARIGAKVRLEELNKERDTLLDFLGYPDDLKSKIIKKRGPYKKNGKRKKPHWTQTPAGRKHMSDLARQRYGK